MWSCPLAPWRELEHLEEAGPGVLGVTRSGHLIGMIALETELDPLADPLAHAVRRGGRRLVVAGVRSGLGERLGADVVIAGGARLAASVRSLQAQGHGVLAVLGAPRTSLCVPRTWGSVSTVTAPTRRGAPHYSRGPAGGRPPGGGIPAGGARRQQAKRDPLGHGRLRRGVVAVRASLQRGPMRGLCR